MNEKLYPNMRRITTWFAVGIVVATFSMLALRLTVFSDMVEPDPQAVSDTDYSQAGGGYKINSEIYFQDATSKGDVSVTNLSTDNLIKVTISMRDGDRQSILSTGFIKPGDSLPTCKLNAIGQKLEDGIYPCVAEISAHKSTDYKGEIGSSKLDLYVYIGVKPKWMESDSKK